MSKVAVIQRPDGGISICPTVRDQREGETDAQFRHAVTRRALGEILAAAHGATMSNEELVSYLKLHDDAMTLEAEAAKIGAVVVGLVNSADIPVKDDFRNGWSAQGGRIVFDLPKCKTIAHDKRREKREAEFKPHDDIIAKQIPGKDAAAAEAARAAIRAKYDAMQAAIDAAANVDEIKAALA